MVLRYFQKKNAIRNLRQNFEANAEHPTDDGCSEVATVDVTEAYPDEVDCAEPEH